MLYALCAAAIGHDVARPLLQIGHNLRSCAYPATCVMLRSNRTTGAGAGPSRASAAIGPAASAGVGPEGGASAAAALLINASTSLNSSV